MKPGRAYMVAEADDQPPSGGCVLKRLIHYYVLPSILPAAFGRLCVETISKRVHVLVLSPAAFGRLCVETLRNALMRIDSLPAAFGRLCVETNIA